MPRGPTGSPARRKRAARSADTSGNGATATAVQVAKRGGGARGLHGRYSTLAGRTESSRYLLGVGAEAAQMAPYLGPTPYSFARGPARYAGVELRTGVRDYPSQRQS